MDRLNFIHLDIHTPRWKQFTCDLIPKGWAVTCPKGHVLSLTPLPHVYVHNLRSKKNVCVQSLDINIRIHSSPILYLSFTFECYYSKHVINTFSLHRVWRWWQEQRQFSAKSNTSTRWWFLVLRASPEILGARGEIKTEALLVIIIIMTKLNITNKCLYIKIPTPNNLCIII